MHSRMSALSRIRSLRFLPSMQKYYYQTTKPTPPSVPPLKVLFCCLHFSEGKPWEPLADTIFHPHQIRTCTRPNLLDTLHAWHPDVLVPWWYTLDSTVLDLAPPSLSLIHQFGVGLDNVDVASATRHGIWVTRLPSHGTGNADTVSEHAILLMLALSRDLSHAQDVVREGSPFGRLCGVGMLGKTMCIVGLGDIGQALAVRLSTWRMRITAVRNRAELGAPQGLEGTIAKVYSTNEMEHAVGEADYVVCAVKYDRERNYRMFDARLFAAMKPGARFVNVARGGLVDEEALCDALEQGHLAGAGLDVFEQEPLDTGSRLLTLKNVIATPHIAGLTDSFYEMGAAVFAENVGRFARGEMIRYAVNQPEKPRKVLREVVEGSENEAKDDGAMATA